MENVSSQIFTASWDAGGNSIAYQEPWSESGAFTTMRLDVGKSWRCPYLFEQHIERLFKTFDTLELRCLYKRPWLEQCVKDFIQTIPDEGTYLLRVMMSDVIVSLSAKPRVEPAHMQLGHLWEYSRPTPNLKTLDYSDILDALSDIDRSREELLLVSEDDRLLEGATTCLMFVQGQRVVVPSRERLDSITLKLVLERLQGLEIVEDDVYCTELKQYEEILLCGCGKGIVNLGEIPELEWQCRSINTFRKVRILHDNALIRYKHNWI